MTDEGGSYASYRSLLADNGGDLTRTEGEGVGDGEAGSLSADDAWNEMMAFRRSGILADRQWCKRQ